MLEMITMFWPWPFVIAGIIFAVLAVGAMVGGNADARGAGYSSYRHQWREKDVENWLAMNPQWDDERKELEANNARASWHKRYGPL